MTHIPDPDDDFDGCFKALYDEAWRVTPPLAPP
jgi:hypothetical protein